MKKVSPQTQQILLELVIAKAFLLKDLRAWIGNLHQSVDFFRDISVLPFHPRGGNLVVIRSHTQSCTRV